MELTWIAIAASLLMGSGALLIFIWAVRSRHFQSFEDVKYQVFWSDQEIPVEKDTISKQEQKNGSNGNRNQVK
jgi:cbb3-type cytochrome oxidase maturation protein